MSYLLKLVCSVCEKDYDPEIVQTFCKSCNAPLFARYDLDAIKLKVDRDEISYRLHGMWRWHEVLPVKNPINRLYLGEGDTPLLQLKHLGDDLGFHNLYVKEESANPTGTFKARGLSVALSKAKELGIMKVIIPTAGNAGGALAAYAAHGGLAACIFMPKDTPLANIKECQIMGAEVNLVDGLISDAAKLAEEKALKEGWFDISTFKEPYRCEGKKIMGYELAERFAWGLPDVIIYPTGGGTGLVGMWKAFTEMETLGWLTNPRRPRMVAVQTEGCAPVIKALREGKEICEFWPDAQTKASGLRVPKSFADREILRNIRESKGTAVSVSETAIQKAQQALAYREGIFAAPEGAATLAALQALIEGKWIEPNERIVLFNTGTGLKYIG